MLPQDTDKQKAPKPEINLPVQKRQEQAIKQVKPTETISWFDAKRIADEKAK